MCKRARMEALLKEFRDLKESQRAEVYCRMVDLVGKYELLRPTFAQDKVGRFNTFRLLNIGTDEVRHSQVLAWLLNHKSEHGQENMFLRSFLEASGIPLQLEGDSNYEVFTEYSGWESIIDIVIYQPRLFLVYVENKVLANEGFEQLAREYRDMNRLGESLSVPEHNRFAVFLTPAGHPPISAGPSQWTSLSYGKLRAAFRETLKFIQVPKSRWLVEDWLEAIGDWSELSD